VATIQTVLGPIDANDLGFTLSHEHIASVGFDGRFYPWRIDRKRMVDVAAAKLATAKAEGIDAVIEMTTPDLGRDADLLAEISRATGVHLIATTGLWFQPPINIGRRTVDQNADIFVREIEVGIDDTGIKAGVIKFASDTEGITELLDNVARAAARAAKRTGVPINTHHWTALKQGLEQIRIFKEEGLPPHLIAIGHSADSTDVEYLEAMLNEGVYLSMDRYPMRPDRPHWQERNVTVQALVERGWAHRIMLGHDTSVTSAMYHDSPDEQPPFYADFDGNGIYFLTRVGIPGLRESGVSQDDIDMMMREAPRRFLAGEE
jgi:phosphotriesterase-related protein